MRTLLPPVLLLAACASEPPEVVRLDGPAPLVSEVGVSVEEEATVTNLHPELDLIVSDIRFAPAELDLQWFGDVDWTIPPGEARTFRVWFKPAEIGTWEGTLTVGTDAGDVTAPLQLEGNEGIDADGDGFTVALGDCDDSDETTFPDAPEVCDDVDNDCDDLVDEDFDADRDGYLDEDVCPVGLGDDCNDDDRTTHPGMEEECDGTDSDCNGEVDDIDDLADLQAGVCAGARKRCTAGGPVEPDYTAIEDYEFAEISCDGLDNDCDGGVDDFDRLGDGTLDCVDDDGDGEREVDGDCDDTDARITSEDCGPSTLVVTRNDDGFATIDLNTGAVERFSIGLPTYHGVATGPETLWFAARDERRLVQVDLATSTGTATGRFDASPWAVGVGTGGELLVLLGDGRIQRRRASDGNYIDEVEIGRAPTAWTQDTDDTWWICSGDGHLLHATSTALLHDVDVGTNCYGPPALDGTRLVMAGLDDSAIVEIDTTTRERVRTRPARRAPVRALWVDNDLWASTAVNATVDVFEGVDLLNTASVAADGQTQGLWYDPVRDRIWVAVFGADEVIAIDRKTRTIVAEVPVPEPVYLFPLPAGG